MAGCCSTYLFFSYSAGAVIYFILGLFASTNNVALLAEHYKFGIMEGNSTKDIEDERDNVKFRTSMSYYFAYFLSLGLAILLYIFYIRKKPEEKKKPTRNLDLILKDQDFQPILLNQSQNEISLKKENNIDNNKDNNKGDNVDDDNILKPINANSSGSSIGMGENEI